MKQTKALTTAFILVSIIVSAGIIWVACNFVDSIHNNVQATKEIHIHGDTREPERGFDGVSAQFSKQIDSMSSAEPYHVKPKTSQLKGSEVSYEKALVASTKGDFKTALEQVNRALKQIPDEASTRSSWYADEKARDKRTFTALAYSLRGYCLVNLARYTEAIQDLDKAIALRPTCAANFTNRGKAYKLIGQKARGEADLNHARELPVAKEEDVDVHALDELAGHE